MPVMGRVVPALVCCIALSHTAFANKHKQDTGFLDRAVRVNGVVYRYQVYIPYEWTNQKRWPVILSLHGAAERGGDGLKATQFGIAAAIRHDPERFPFIAVFPQCRAGTYWIDKKMQQQALKALDEAIKEFHGDPRRVYVTGFSMGGYATWDFARQNPGRFAAVAPICGGVTRAFDNLEALPKSANVYEEVARQIGKTPVWVFHGRADPVIPVSESRKMVEALKAVGGNVRYSEYEGVGHNAWDKAYTERDFVPWLLSHEAPRK